jgi:hypothetical protein
LIKPADDIEWARDRHECVLPKSLPGFFQDGRRRV